MPTTAFVVVSQMRHREPFGDCPAGNFVVLELHPLLADRQPCPNPTSSCDQRSVRETLNGESVIHALLRPTQRYPVDAVRPTGGHLEHGDVAALVLGDGSFNDTTANQCSSPPVVPTIEPPGFEVGHFFITSRSRLPIGSGDLGSVVVLFAAMSKSETVVRGTNVRCSTCRHIQWVPVDKTAFACERCDAQLTRR